MSDTRRRVLQRVRRSLHRQGPLSESTIRGLEARMNAHLSPFKSRILDDPVEQFLAKVKAAAGSAQQVLKAHAVPDAVLDFMTEHALGQTVVMASDPLLTTLSWSNHLSIDYRAAQEADRVSVTSAFAGVAETGTVVLVSTAEHPTTLNFLPETHIVVLERARIVGYWEEVWAKLRDRPSPWPRTVNMITGPSRTGDVELQLELGAHGPRRLHVILINDEHP